MKKVVFILTVLVLFSLVDKINAEVITVEDLYTGVQTAYFPLPSGYAGFTWSDHAGFMTKNYLSGTGYEYGTIGNASIYTAAGDPISMSKSSAFDFNGAYITSAYLENEDVTVEGWREGETSPAYSETILTHKDGPYWFDFNFQDVNKVEFIPLSICTDKHLAIDNITYNIIPEPTSLSLLGLGLLGLLGSRKKLI